MQPLGISMNRTYSIALLTLCMVTSIIQSMQTEALFDAINKNDLSCVTTLIKKEPKLANSASFLGVPPLTFALNREHMPIAKALIQAGADVNQKFAGETPLLQAILKKDTQIVKLLLQKGANPNDPNTDKNSDGFTPLMLTVAIIRSYAITRLLIQAGAKVNYDHRDNRGRSLGAYLRIGSPYWDDQMILKLLEEHGL